MTLTAADVRDALRRRWPDSEYLTIEEAPDSPDRLGGKLDLLVVSLWRSRGYQLDGVEIKVSMSDWQRELKNAAKADWWWRHVHRFWVAVPIEIAPRVRDGLPPGWGLLACDREAKPKELVKAERREAAALAWPNVVGLLRASANAGFGALQRAEQRGYDRGKGAGDKRDPDAVLKAQLEDARETIRTFERESGVPLNGFGRAASVGRLVRLIEEHIGNPASFIRQLASASEQLQRRATDCRDLAAEIESALTADVPG